MQFKQSIATQLSTITGHPETQLIEMIERPKNKDYGQFSIAVYKLMKNGMRKKRKLDETKSVNLEENLIAGEGKERKAADELCKELAEKFQSSPTISSTTPIGPYLNFHVQRPVFIQHVLNEVFGQKNLYGTFKSHGQGRTVVIDFSSPNIAKPFHSGHLKSTILGNFVKRIHDALGYKTVAINYLGDWGKQYGLLAVGFNKYGSHDELDQDSIKHLYDVYVKISQEAKHNPVIDQEANNYIKRMEDGDESVLSLWRKFRDLSIKEYKSMYKRLNIEFTSYSGESETQPLIPQVERLLTTKNLLSTQDDGICTIDLSEYNLGTPQLKRIDETSVYLLRDIVAAIQRKQLYNFDRMFYIVGMSQQNHFQRLFKILELTQSGEGEDGGKWAEKLEHVGFGMIRGVSTRHGTAVFLKDILDTAKQRMLDIMMGNKEKYQDIINSGPSRQVQKADGSQFIDNSSFDDDQTALSDENSQIDLIGLYGKEAADRIADIVGISAIVIHDFTRDRYKDYTFDWKKTVDAHGHNGVYLQYAHARLSSIEEKAGVKLNPRADLETLQESEAFDLAYQISLYPEIVLQSYKDFQPYVIVNYLFNLSQSISHALRTLRVKGMDPEVAEPRLLLFWCARVTLGNGLNLLGLTPLEKM
ncbi:2700_t:CDS:2 [Paraglomus brasilianum]|uniref:arginine--tRNA ligase n=1 Tax=Paraglomus brasilianum TaxID=144538 RepID=A0A9N9GIX1_9GLOM|nr:2700_t:CDS:2 [Paraglomus brasilianum]